MTEKTSSSQHGIKDNHTRGRVADFLAAKLVTGSRLSAVSAYFTIYAYEALSKELDGIGSLRFLFGEPRFIQSLDPEKTDKKAFKIEDEGLELANRLQQKEVARRCAEWIESKVEIRSIRETNLLHGKLYHIDDGRREHALMGSSNFTRRGLGLSSTPNRTKLQDAPYGLYGVVPASTEHAAVKPGVIYCLRQQAHKQVPGHETVNPLSPYFLVYVQADGTVRYNFTAPKQVLEIFRALCQGKTEPYAEMCKLFDTETGHGQNMSNYSALLDQAVAAIVAQFARKNAANLFTGRGGKLMDATKAVKSNNDFELITWLVIKNT